MSQEIRVLVGDDDVNDRFFLEWGFKQTSPSVRLDFARTGEEVIENLEDNSRPKPALLIIDSMMPGRAGRRDRFLLEVPIIICSSTPVRIEEELAREFGATEYFCRFVAVDF